MRQSNLENYVPEIDVIPNDDQKPVFFTAAIRRKLKNLSGVYPGFSLRENSRSIQVIIPDSLRVRSGSTFSQLVELFLKCVRNPQFLPSWEQPNLLAKYYITTTAVRMANK